MEDGRARDSMAHGWQPIGSHHVRLELAPGEKETVQIPVRIEDLAYWDAAQDAWVVEKVEHVVHVGPNQRDLPLSATFLVADEGAVAQ